MRVRLALCIHVPVLLGADVRAHQTLHVCVCVCVCVCVSQSSQLIAELGIDGTILQNLTVDLPNPEVRGHTSHTHTHTRIRTHTGHVSTPAEP